MRRLAATLATLATLALALAAGLLIPACPGTSDVQTEVDPDSALQTGVQQLEPYDFGARTTNGIRWLDNYALNQPHTPAALRARHRILRTRIDWLTAAYVEEDPDQRVARLIALMDHLGVEHTDEIDNQAVFGVLESLDAQAAGLEAVPEYTASASSARHFLEMLRHLDLAPGYFEATEALGLNNTPPEQGLAFQPGGPQDFALNALLVVLADLSSNLPAAAKLDPSRQSHAWARLLAYPCPKGFSAFASAALEDRVRPLQEACGWPCPTGTEVDASQPAWRTCPRAILSPPELYSLDNEVTLRAVARLERLRGWARAAGRATGPTSPYPLLRHDPNLIERLLATSTVTDVPLSLPEDAGHALAHTLTLPQARYAPHPGLAPIVILADGKSLRVATWPWATFDDRDHVQVSLAPDDPRAPWAFPGKALPDTIAQPLLTDPTHADPTLLTHELRALLDAQARAHGTTTEAFLAAHAAPPTLLLDADTPATLIVTLATALRAAGFRRLQLAVADPLFHRMAALPLELVKAPVADAPTVTLDTTGLALRTDPKARTPLALPRHGSALPASELYLALFPSAARQTQELYPSLNLDVRAGTFADLVHLIDAVRYWRQLPPGASALDVINAEPQDAGGVPKLLVGYFALLPP